MALLRKRPATWGILWVLATLYVYNAHLYQAGERPATLTHIHNLSLTHTRTQTLSHTHTSTHIGTHTLAYAYKQNVGACDLCCSCPLWFFNWFQPHTKHTNTHSSARLAAPAFILSFLVQSYIYTNQVRDLPQLSLGYQSRSSKGLISELWRLATTDRPTCTHTHIHTHLYTCTCALRLTSADPYVRTYTFIRMYMCAAPCYYWHTHV